MMPRPKKISRALLRGLTDGQSVTVVCRDWYELDSQRSTAYTTARLEGCRFSCRAMGLTLTVTRHDGE